MFALVRDLSARREVTEIAVSRWLVQRHNLGALAALAGVSRLRDDLATATVRWAAIARELPELIARFCDAKAGIAPIKGVAYAAGLYTVPAARPMTDVDLLVQPGREHAARDVLERAKFRLVGDVPLHHATMWERGDLTIDLHRDIVPAGRGRVALDDVWDRTRDGWPHGARRLEPTDELVFQLVHMARNRLCGPMIQVVDAARLLEHASGEAALARASEWQLDAAVHAALMYCRAVLDDTSLPRVVPPADDVLFARQPRAVHKLVFDVATAGSLRHVIARAIGASVQWFARS
ncbi:MAG TPA: nucleotidyltransferase family protein [Kofleriaceae bacterium]